MEKPSFKSSPWILGAPHRVFSRDIRRTRWRISLDTGGRPGFLRRDFHVQKSLNPLRCQPMTVSGLTITRAWRQPGHRQDRMTQTTLSAFRSDGRGLFRFRTATCCRRARISVWSAARSAKISMILCMPERYPVVMQNSKVSAIDGINGRDSPSWRVVFSVYDNPKALHAAELRHNADLTGHAVCSGDGETVSEDPAAELEAQRSSAPHRLRSHLTNAELLSTVNTMIKPSRSINHCGWAPIITSWL